MKFSREREDGQEGTGTPGAFLGWQTLEHIHEKAAARHRRWRDIYWSKVPQAAEEVVPAK